MTIVHPHIHFDGCCRKAFDFYLDCFGGRIFYLMTWGDSPSAREVPASWQKKILHASFQFEGYVISGGDVPPKSFLSPQGMRVYVGYDDRKRAKKVFQTLTAKGRVLMPFAKTYWSTGYGIGKDQFGVSWMINTNTQF